MYEKRGLLMKLEKIDVSRGIYWIKVPSINVRILCSTPSDTVKRLISNGLIRTKEKAGVVYETGPNYILLSDLMVQNSQFSNLSEFPILQMLYRQGMLIPGHPGNDGTRPTLIGSKEQVDIQMQYIYHGNYGFTDKEELKNTGITDELAKEIMDIKLKFAFGEFKKSDELINKIYVENGKTEIKDGLYIQRKDVNIFEFSFEDEKVLVDLNMSKSLFYEPTYHLAHTHFNKEYFSVIHTGEGDGWDIKRPCMGSIITFQGKIYLIDAGPNINKTLNALGISVNEIDGIFHTHAHDDHFAGITLLIQNDHKIKYYASAVVRESVLKKLSILLSISKDKLNNFFDFKNLELDVWNNIDGLEVKPILSPHPIETNIFYFRTLGSSEYKSYGHLADTCSFNVLDNIIFKDDTTGLSDRVKSSYLEPVNLKKIDNGGGMIHGMGQDFVHDDSDKLMLSHSAVALTPELKQIGSGAPFGSIDVLIPAQKDYDYKNANIYLKSSFPDVDEHWINLLLNNEMILFNSESIIIQDNKINEFVYVIITGNVEMIQTKENIYNTLSSGAIIGDFSATNQTIATRTYRAASYVRALAIPCTQYKYFVKSNNLYDDIQSIHQQREFLENTWLFGESISYSILNNISRNLVSKKFKENEKIENTDGYSLQLIKSGKVSLRVAEKEFCKLDSDDFFDENYILHTDDFMYDSYAMTECEIVDVKDSAIQDIPIIFWKLYTSHEKRIKQFRKL
jgi:hemerythrin